MQPFGSRKALDRRLFLKVTAAGVSTFPALAETTTSRLSELGGLQLGLIGLGERGLFLLNHFKEHCSVRALCDVHHGRLEESAAKGAVGSKQVSDYRQLLDDKSLTGVVIATPDHWHARIVLDSLRAGKHVFCETPVCRTLAESAALVSAARNSKLKTQAGIQGRANSAAFAACRYVREGQLGKVHTVRFWSTPDSVFVASKDLIKPPKELDWPFWLGPLKSRPYDESLFKGDWRFVDEIGGGYLMSRGSELFALLSWFLGHEFGSRVEIAPKTGEAKHPFTGAAHEIQLEFRFKNPDFRCQWETTTGPAAAHDPGWGIQCVGDKGDLTMLGGDAECHVKNEIFAYKPKLDFNDLKWNFAPDHRLNWLQCIAGHGRPTMPIEDAARAAAVCIAGRLARRLKRKLTWDFAKNEFVDDPEANGLRDAAVDGNPWTVRM